MKRHLVLIAVLLLLSLHGGQTFAQTKPQGASSDGTNKEVAPAASAQNNGDDRGRKTQGDKGGSKAGPDSAEGAAAGQNKTADKAADKTADKAAGAAAAAAEKARGKATNPEPAPTPVKRVPGGDEPVGPEEPADSNAVGRAARLAEENNKLKQDLATAQGQGLSLDDLGPLAWFTSPLVFWTAALLFLLALGLHALHLMKETHTSRVLGQLWNLQQKNASAARTAVPGKSGAVESLAEQVREQGQGLSRFATQMGQFQAEQAERDKQFADAVQALALTASWVSQAQLRAAESEDGHVSEAERASAVALLERYEEPLRANAGRVEPLAQAVAALVEKLETQQQLPQELLGRAQSLYREIGQFDLWQRSVSDQLASLRRGSFSSRSAALQTNQQRLVEQANAGDISVTQMVQKSRELIDQHFPRGAQKSPAKLPSAEDEAELKKRVSGAPEFLMDWFDSFSQFHSQMLNGQASRLALDADITSRLAQTQTLARETLSKFDIQPEEIHVGRTGYDRRLHEATLIRQSSQFPINTVIEVLQCGFRRMSTGEVLRRPQVVVAGAAAG